MNVKKITSIFVEGITDVALYRAFLIYKFSYSRLSEREETFVKEDLLKKQIKTELLPCEQVRFLKSSEHIVLIQAKDGYDRLRKFCEEIRNALPRIERKIKDSLLDVKSFFIFDDEIPDDCNNDYFPKFIDIVSQRMPEEIIWSLIDQFWKKRKDVMQVFQKVEHCLKIIEEETENTIGGDVSKRRINFLKSIFGERCHDHLLKELLKGTSLADEMANLLPESVVKRFSEESSD